MNNLRGFTTVRIGGKLRPVKFGTNQTIVFCQLRGITLKDYAETFKQERLDNYSVDGSESRDLIWSALKDGARYKNQDFEYKPEDIGDWLDNVDESELKKMFSAIVTPTIEKPAKKKVSQQKK